MPVFGVAKTVADLLRYRRTLGDALAIEALRQALRRRKAPPAQIAREAEAAGVWATMEPCVMALTSDSGSPAKSGGQTRRKLKSSWAHAAHASARP